MKKIFLPLLLLLVVFQLKATKLDLFFNEADVFFKKHVKSGSVNYAAIKSNQAELQALVNQLETMAVSGANERTEAFYINAYNIIVIHNVVKLYPIKSPLDVDGFFDKKKHKIANEYLTLNDIENEKLRKVYNDPRIHFVLVCAAKGCPQLGTEAIKPATISQQLDARTKIAINDPLFIRVKTSSNLVLVSEIFKWYKIDFIKGENFQDLIAFINKYRKEGTAVSTKLKVDFYPYNWTLNKL